MRRRDPQLLRRLFGVPDAAYVEEATGTVRRQVIRERRA
jgi:hypothetical protein